MSLFTKAELDHLAGGFVVANAPISLWLWLDRHSAIGRVAELVDEDRILDRLVALLRAPERSESVLAEAYALLAAVIAKRRRAGPIGMPPIDLGALRWGESIWARARRDDRATGTAIIAGPEPRIEVRPDVPAGGLILGGG